MAPRAVLFDLDGTLLDTAPDMVGALNKLRMERQLAPLPFEAVRSSVSHGAARLVKLGFPNVDEGTFAALQKRFLDLYAGAKSAETRLFDGMDQVLVQAAHAAGMPALVAAHGYVQADEDWRAWGGDGFIRQPSELLDWLDRP